LKGAAANLAVGGELLRADTRINEQFESLSAVRTLNILGHLHPHSLADEPPPEHLFGTAGSCNNQPVAYQSFLAKKN
jgi:hypothetical protein